MQISRATAPTSTPSPAPADELVTIGPDTELPTGTAASPALEFLRRYQQVLFAIPGVTNLSYRPTVGLDVTLSFRSEATRQIAEMILEDTLLGVNILTERATWAGGSPDPDPSLWKHQSAIAAVNALPGVWNSQLFNNGWKGNAAVKFHTVNQKTIDLFDPLIRNKIEGQIREDGSTRWYDVTWEVVRPPA